jgi:hypothetical protein
MLGGNSETGVSTEEDYFRQMSPVDRLKFERELANKREYTPAEASKNIEDALTGLAYSTPGVANAMSIRDAYEAKERAGKSEPGSRERQQAEAESAMSALSAFLPFSLGKPSTGSASRLGVFAGPAAKTADQDALALAQRMEKAGAGRDEIIDATNWFKDVDGKWKFEIDDSSMTAMITPAGYPSFRDITKTVKHPELFKAYPQLRDIDLIKDNYGTAGRGSFAGSFDSNMPPSIRVAPGDAKQNRSTMLHELQHGVQNIEGFGRGGSAMEYASGPMFSKRATDLQGDLSRELTGGASHKPFEIAKDLKYGDRGALEGIAKKHGFDSLDDAMSFLAKEDEMRTPFGQYRRQSGEVEARNVEARKDMRKDERRVKRPWETQDVPDNEQIVRFYGEGPQDVFVPVKDEAAITKSRNIFDDLADEIGPGFANRRVYGDTDTFFGPEGTLLREIRDNPGMEIKGTFAPGKSYRVDEIIDHPELFKEYPELRKKKVRFLDSPQDPRADRYTGSDPQTGEMLIDESFQGNDLRVQLAKLLQYRINAKEHRINAAREGANTKIADSNMAIENTRAAIADGIVPEELGNEYIRSLEGTLNEGRKIRSTATVSEPGSFAELKGYPAGTPLNSRMRKTLEGRFWTDKSAGKQEIKAVKTRAFSPERTGFPYRDRAFNLEGAAVIPHPGTTGEYLKTFIEKWKKYGAGRSKAK